MNLYEQLGEDLRPRLSVNSDLSFTTSNQALSALYKKSITDLAIRIENNTGKMLTLLTTFQLIQLQTWLLVDHNLNYSRIFEKGGQWHFMTGTQTVTLKQMETSVVLDILEAAERVIML